MFLKIFGLIVVVFGTILISILFFGLSEGASHVGAIIAASTYVFTFQGESK